MNTLNTKITALQEKLQELSFSVTQDHAKQENHSKVINCIVLLSEIQKMIPNSKVVNNDHHAEINKVKRRLSLWTKRQDQMNARILNAFLELESKYGSGITEGQLSSLFSADDNFSSNFAQMKIISARNHGKVFEHKGDFITLWKPITAFVREYQEILNLINTKL